MQQGSMPHSLGKQLNVQRSAGLRETCSTEDSRRASGRRAGSREPQISYSASRRSVINMCPGLCVIIKAGLACLAAAWGVTPQAQNTGV